MVNVPADDFAAGVDAKSERGRSAWKIDGGESAFPEQEAMGDTAGDVEADDIALRVIPRAKVAVPPGISIVLKLPS